MKKLFMILLASSAAAAASAQDPAPGNDRKAESHEVHKVEKARVGGDDDCDGVTARHGVSGTVKNQSGAGAAPAPGGEAQRHAIKTKGTAASGRTDTQETAGKYSAPINVDRGTASQRGEGPAVPPAASASSRASHDVAMSCPRNLR